MNTTYLPVKHQEAIDQHKVDRSTSSILG